MLRIALIFANGIKGYNDRARACIEQSGVNLIPSGLASPVSCNHDDARQLSASVIGAVNDSCYPHPELRTVCDAMSDDARHRHKAAKVVCGDGGHNCRNKERSFGLLTPAGKLLVSSGSSNRRG